MSDSSPDFFSEFDLFFSSRNFERSRRFHLLHKYNPEPLKSFLKYLGNPQLRYKTIHIAGTAGKGSTAAYLARSLQQNCKTGLYISPHYENISERISINEINITTEQFSDLWKDFKSNNLINQLSYFDAMTAMAMLFFHLQKVEWAVFETGLGGRQDSTNNLMPEFCVLTEIGMDHQNILGNTIKDIAQEKAGIMHSGIPVYAAIGNLIAADVIREEARKIDCPLFFFENKLSEESYLEKNYNFVSWIYSSVFGSTMPIIAKKLKGRLEILNINPMIIFDSAHNEVSFRELVAWMHREKNKSSAEWNIYINTMKERNIADAFRVFENSPGHKINFFLYPIDDSGYYNAKDLINLPNVKTISVNDFHKLLNRKDLKHLVTGSIRLYSHLKKVLENVSDAVNLP